MKIQIIAFLLLAATSSLFCMQPPAPAKPATIEQIKALMSAERAKPRVESYLGFLPTELRQKMVGYLKREYEIRITNYSEDIPLNVRVGDDNGDDTVRILSNWHVLKGDEKLAIGPTRLHWPLYINVTDMNGRPVLITSRARDAKENARLERLEKIHSAPEQIVTLGGITYSRDDLQFFKDWSAWGAPYDPKPGVYQLLFSIKVQQDSLSPAYQTADIDEIILKVHAPDEHIESAFD